MTKTLIAAAMAVVLGLSTAQAAGTSDAARYAKRSGRGPNLIVIRKDCLGAEDSAAHLRLVDYSSTRVVLSCNSRGY